MSKRRRRFTPEQKAGILREHLIDRVSVSDLCDKHQIQPNVFYRWQKEVFENLPGLFEKKADSRQGALERENVALKQKCAGKDEVIAEIMADLIQAKKKSGGA
jgi:transposase